MRGDSLGWGEVQHSQHFDGIKHSRTVRMTPGRVARSRGTPGRVPARMLSLRMRAQYSGPPEVTTNAKKPQPADPGASPHRRREVKRARCCRGSASRGLSRRRRNGAGGPDAALGHVLEASAGWKIAPSPDDLLARSRANILARARHPASTARASYRGGDQDVVRAARTVRTDGRRVPVLRLRRGRLSGGSHAGSSTGGR